MPDDILLSHNATIGRVAVVPKFEGRLLVGTSLTYFRVDPTKISPRYLAAYFSGADFQNQLVAVMSLSTRNQVPITAQRHLRIVLPPLSEQNAIAHTLGVLDDKIELNRRMNETLEAMARAIFKSWFVDFDPVRTKNSNSRRPGLNPTIARLFPSRFTEQQGKLIPESWNLAPLDKITDFLNGLALQKFPPTGTKDWPVIKIAELRRGNTVGSDLANGTLPPEYLVSDGDVLFSWSGSLEVVLWCGGKGALNQHLFKVTSSKYPKWFYYLWVKEHLQGFQAIAAAKATTMGHIQRHHLTEAKVTIPTQEVIRAAHALLGPIFELVIKNNLQARTLGTLRDTLLPKILSGQVRINQAGKTVEAHV